MAIPALPTWYQANFQYILTSLHRIRQALENYITRTQASPIQIPSEIKLASEALAVLHNHPSALDRLCNLFNLSFFERDILLLCVGLELAPDFEKLCAKAQENVERNYPTLGLALLIFPETHLRVLSSQSPLQYWNLIEIESGQTLTKSPIKINKRILCYLFGEPSLDDELAGIVKAYPTGTLNNISLPYSHQKIANQIVETWLLPRQTVNLPVVQLCGAELTSKYVISSTACSNLGFNLSVISAAIVPTNPNELHYIMQRCWREAILSNSALLLECDEINSADTNRELAISQFITGLNIPLIITTQERIPQRQRPTRTIDVNQPTHSEQRDISLHVRQRAKVYQEWGFAGKGGKGLGISALFSGASGTGKTMAAEVLAHELRLDLYRIDLSAVVSKYIGETEKNLRRIFDAAETGGGILLFDEADALFGKRTQVKDSHDRHANVEVSYLLQRMEAYQGLAILTTNLKESLDQAFLRRIRFLVKFPFPDGESRRQIWQQIFPQATPTQKLDFKKLGNLSMSGGNIRNIALNAAFIAADTGEAVMMKHILQAAKSECVKLEKSLTDVEVLGWV